VDAVRSGIAGWRKDGYARLGVLLDPELRDALRARADAIMLGEITYPGMFFQLDSESGRYEDLERGLGWRGPSLRYRKVEKLEKDPLFFRWLTSPVFEALAREAYPEADRITIYRAILMTKAEDGGSNLPWHQDGGRLWGLDREPELQAWTALDDAPEDGGCLEVVPGSHVNGVAAPLGGLVPDDRVAAANAEQHVVKLPAVAGEVILLHNHLWHRSGRALTGKPRRAFSVSYLDGRTLCTRKKGPKRAFPVAFKER